MRILLVLAVLAPLAAAAQQPFEVAVSGASVIGCEIIPLSDSKVEWFNPNVVDDVNATAIASGDGQRVLALLSGSPVRVVQLSPDGTQTPFFNGFAGQFGLDIAVAITGRVFVWVGGPPRPMLAVLSPTGALEATYALPNVAFLAVGPDGCTLFYFDSGVIRRINGCTGAPLPDFATVSGFITDLAPLPTGELLVARSGDVLLYDASGALVRTVGTVASYGFTSETVNQIAVRNGVVWIAVANICDPSGTVLQVSLDSGAELSRRFLHMNSVSAIVIGTAAEATIPTLSEMMLMLLVLALAAGGALVLKLR